MNINEKKFTDDEYLTKREIESKIGNNEIESVWRNVTDYREKYRYAINLRKNDTFSFSVCLTPSLLTYCSVSERKLAKFAMKYNELSVKQNLSSDKQLELFCRNLIKEDLIEIAKHYNFRVNLSDVDLVLSTSYDSSNPISNFYKGYKFLLEGNRIFSLDTILELNKILIGNEESHFRKTEDALAAPTYKIHDYMDSLIAFVNNYNEYSCILIAPIVYSYIKFVRPFEKYNSLIGLLLSLKIFKDAGYNNSAFFTGLIKKVINDEKKFAKSLEYSRVYGDFTYVLISYAQNFIESLDAISEQLFHMDIIPNITGEPRIIEKIVEVTKEVPVEKTVEVIKEVPVEKTVEVIKEVQVEKPVEIVKEVPVAKPNVLVEQQIATKIYIDAMDMSEIAKSLMDKDPTSMGEGLLESNPNMKYHQAHFFATHHEVGRYYTIGQFKDYALCAYETARTSMDYLAACKLYKKEQLKNKFVYKAIEL